MVDMHMKRNILLKSVAMVDMHMNQAQSQQLHYIYLYTSEKIYTIYHPYTSNICLYYKCRALHNINGIKELITCFKRRF